MKSMGIFLLFSWILLAGRDSRLTGTWYSEEDEFSFVAFDNEGYVTLYSEDDTLGGKRFFNEDDDEFQSLTYQSSGKGDTLNIDFILTSLLTKKEVSRAQGLYTIRHDSLIFAIDGFGEPRGEYIDEIDAFFFLRVKGR